MGLHVVQPFSPDTSTVRDIRISNQLLIVLSILHKYAKRIIKQASLSHWVAEYNLKVSSVVKPSVVVQNGEPE